MYGTIIYDDLGDTERGPHQRNVTIFGDGWADRSPCGSGTAARLALLAEDGRLDNGRILTHDSIIGTRFIGRVKASTTVIGGHTAIVPQVEGTAFKTGEHTFFRDPLDPLTTGFVLH